jgi:hypothetical protein
MSKELGQPTAARKKKKKNNRQFKFPISLKKNLYIRGVLVHRTTNGG